MKPFPSVAVIDSGALSYAALFGVAHRCCT